VIDVLVAGGLFLFAALAGAWLIETRLRQHREANRSWETVEHNRIVAAIEAKLEETIRRFLPGALDDLREELRALSQEQGDHGRRIEVLEQRLGVERDARSIEEQIGLPTR
jgi:hypothetical protein